MDAHGACDLCGEPVGADGSGEIAELSLCPACHAGDFWDRLVDRGIRLQCFGKAHYSFDGKVGGRTRDVRGAIPYDLGVDGHFSTEDIFTKIGKVFVKELQVGDPAFDDVLYISTDDKDALSELLQDEGLRAAILHAVTAREDKSLVLEGGRLSLDGLSVSIEEVPATLRDLALVLHHLERIARERGLERRPELARYPDLRDTVEYVESCRTIGQKNFWPKAVFLQGATLDDLEPVARIHDGMTPGKQPLQILRLMHSHLISGDLSRWRR